MKVPAFRALPCFVRSVFGIAPALAIIPGCHRDIPGRTQVSVRTESSPMDSPHLSISVSVTGGTCDDRAKIERGRVLAEKAVNDPAFRAAVLSFRSERFGGGAGAGYVQAERVWYCQPSSDQSTCRFPVRSNDEVLAALLAGYTGDPQIHIQVVLTSSANIANTGVGPPDTPTELKPEWLRRADVSDAEVAENLVHEHMHRLGFQHNHDYSVERCGSIPYAVGKLACEAVGGKDCWPALGGTC